MNRAKSGGVVFGADVVETREAKQMVQLSREDFQSASEKAARTSEQQSRDQLTAINGLAEEIRGMALAVSSKVHGRAPEGSGRSMILLGGMAAIVFGLMSPMYTMVTHANRQVEAVDHRMRDDDARERVDAAEFATLTVGLAEVDRRINNLENQEHRGDASKAQNLVRLSRLMERMEKMQTPELRGGR